MQMDFAEYNFRADYLIDKEFNENKNRLIYASFTAWQIGSQNGLKIGWKKYLSELNLAEKSKITEEEKQELTETSKRILMKIGKYGKKKSSK